MAESGRLGYALRMTEMTEDSRGPSLRMTLSELAAFLDRAFPAAARSGLGDLVAIEPGKAWLRLDPNTDMLRPGDLVSGPVLMGLIDVAAYAVVLAHIGPVPMAVTNNLNVNFLRGGRKKTVFAEASLLKLGRRLATIDVRLWQDSDDRPIAHATVGYALPS